MRCALSLACVALLGCSAIVEPDTTRLGGEPAAIDAGTAPGDPPDSGPAPRADAAPACTASHCDGDVLVSCEAGRERRVDCTESESFCLVDRCERRICMPNERECTSDGVLVCNARGDNQTLMPCGDLGCDAATDRCITVSPRCAAAPRITLGTTLLLDLCAEEDDDTHQPAEGCRADQRADVGDETYVLTITEPTDVEIQVTDADLDAAIDTLVYLRRICDDQGSQIACSDDVPCESSTVPGGCARFEVRQSRIVSRLEPGTYYVVVDAYAYNTDRTRFGCGLVQVRVRPTR